MNIYSLMKKHIDEEQIFSRVEKNHKNAITSIQQLVYQEGGIDYLSDNTDDFVDMTIATVAFHLAIFPEFRSKVEELGKSLKASEVLEARKSKAYNYDFIKRGGAELELYTKKYIEIMFSSNEDLLKRLVSFSEINNKHLKKYLAKIKDKENKSKWLSDAKRFGIIIPRARIPFDDDNNVRKYNAMMLLMSIFYYEEKKTEPLSHFIDETIDYAIGVFLQFEFIKMNEHHDLQTYTPLYNKNIFGKTNFSLAESYNDNVLIFSKLDNLIRRYGVGMYPIRYSVRDIESKNIKAVDDILASVMKVSDDKLQLETWLYGILTYPQIILELYRKTVDSYETMLSMTEFEKDVQALDEVNDIKNKNIEMTAEINDFRNKSEKQGKTISSLEKKIDELNRGYKDVDKNYVPVISDLEKENEKLNNKIDELENDRQELAKLRELFFNIEREEEVNGAVVDLSVKIEGKKVAIFGGTKEWQSRLSDNHPITFIDGFKENFPTESIESMDMIFFYTGYMNHSTYHRAMNVINNVGIPYGYITKTNVELVEKEIADKLI